MMNHNKKKNQPLFLSSVLPALSLATGLFMLAGCAGDSWFDPSVVGRWESTAAVAPIIDRLDVIEPAEKDFVQTSNVTPGDLIPDIQAYTIGPADTLVIEVFELFDTGVPYVFQRIVDDTGYISVPLVGPIYFAGFTEAECQRLLADRLSPDILLDPQVSVIAQNKTQNRFSVSGPAGAGLIDIPHPRFRLTEALAAYGSTPFSAENIFVIRQIPLDEAMIRGTSLLKPSMDAVDDDAGTDAEVEPGTEERGEGDVDLGALIDDLATSGATEGSQPSDAGGAAAGEGNQRQPALHSDG